MAVSREESPFLSGFAGAEGEEGNVSLRVVAPNETSLISIKPFLTCASRLKSTRHRVLPM